MRPAAAGQDNTPVWVFDRLLGMEVPASALVQHILPAVAASADDLPDATAAKLRLRLLDEDISQGRVDETTLAYLEDLDSCRVGPLADEALVCPPPGLLLKVKTELSIQTFRDRPMNVGQAEVVLNTVFQGENSAEDYARYEQLKSALRSPEVAQALAAQFPFRRLLVELVKYVERALNALPCFLLALQEDLDSGRMAMQGEGRRQPPAAVALSPAALRIAPAASPHRGWPRVQPSPLRQQPAEAGQGGLAARYGAGAGPEEEEEDVLPHMDDYVSPPAPLPQQQPRSAGRGFVQREQRAVLDRLNAELVNLGQQGGEDPLQEMLGLAEGAQAAGGGAAAAAAAGGRTVMWNSPAVEHPMPEMTPPGRRQQQQPLVQPAAARRRSGRAGAAAEAADDDDGEGRQERGGNQRRKPVRWSAEEEAELVRLVKIHGRGSWAIIQAQGQAKFEGRRGQVDLKDKWRNLVKHDRIEAHHLEEIEAREAEIRAELDAQDKRPPGRPPRFASPTAKRRRRGDAASSDGEEEEEEAQEEEEDPVEDADGEEEAAEEEDDADGEGEAAAAAEEEDQEEEEPQPQPEPRRLRSRRN